MKTLRCLTVLAAALAAALPARAQESARVYALSEVETPPRPTNVQELQAALERLYPPELRDAGLGARVVVQMVVRADGTPGEFLLAESTHPGFDSATIASVAVLRFAPATVRGAPVAVRVDLPIQWQPAEPPPVQAKEEEADFTGTGRPQDEADFGGVGLPDETYMLSEVDTPPRPLNPDSLRAELARLYPAELAAAGRQATVQLGLLVTPEGTVGRVLVISSTDPAFDAATLQAVRVLRFSPGRKDGRAVNTWVELPIVWAR